jgi:hypothetical protein
MLSSIFILQRRTSPMPPAARCVVSFTNYDYAYRQLDSTQCSGILHNDLDLALSNYTRRK